MKMKITFEDSPETLFLVQNYKICQGINLFLKQSFSYLVAIKNIIQLFNFQNIINQICVERMNKKKVGIVWYMNCFIFVNISFFHVYILHLSSIHTQKKTVMCILNTFINII